MVSIKPDLDISDIVMTKSSNSKKSIDINDTEDRIKNADRLAKSLKTYLINSPIVKKRGPPRDARICQLSAAYKYIIHLETKIKTICNKSQLELPDDCNLLHNANIQANNLSYRRRLENSDMTPHTPSQCHNRNGLINECSILTGSASASSPTIAASSNQKASGSSSRPLKNLKNFENINANLISPIPISPIEGNENHFLNEIENFSELEQKLIGSKNIVELCSKTPINSKVSHKRKFKESNVITDPNNNNDPQVIDLNTINSTENNKENLSKRSVQNTPKNITINSNLQTPDNSTQYLPESIGRKHYFLRSTTRLKDMLIANNPVTNKSPLRSSTKNNKTTSKASTSSKSTRYLDSSINSTRSASVATTPSVPNSNMSTNSSNEFESLEAKNLIKINLSHEQVAQLYESNKQNKSISKDNFDFVKC